MALEDGAFQPPNNIPVNIENIGLVDTGNSSAIPLGIGEVFTGDALNITHFGWIFVTVFADVISAVDGLSIEQSMDGVNWDNTDVFTVPAAKGKTYSIQPAAEFLRIVYTNGAVGQAAFRLQTVLKRTGSLASSHRVQDPIVDEDDAELVKAVITGSNPAGDFVNFQSTMAGNFKVSAEESEPDYWKDYFGEVALGNITGRASENKFGVAPNGLQVTITDVWDRANAAATQQIWLAPTAARIHTIASDSVQDDTAGTGIDTVSIQYLADWGTAEAIEVVTGDINAGIVMNNAAVIINRMVVVPQATTLDNNVGTITATAAVDTTISAVILPNNGQTKMAIYGIPSTQSVLIYNWNAQIDKTIGVEASADFVLRINPNPDVQTLSFIGKDDLSVQSDGTSTRSKHKQPPIIFPGPTIVKVSGIASVADLDSDAGFDMVIVDN